MYVAFYTALYIAFLFFKLNGAQMMMYNRLFNKSLKQYCTSLAIGGIFFVSVSGLSACQKNEENIGKGPAEIAGKQIDTAAVEASKELKQAAEATGKVIEKAGAKMQEKAKEAQHE
jgi:hypothetical protein